MPKVCGCCGARGVKKTCGACRAVYYCERSCQKRHWKLHRTICVVHDKINGLAKKYKGRNTFSLCILWLHEHCDRTLYFPLEVSVYDTVDDLKRKIEAERGVPFLDQKLSYRPHCVPSYAEMTMGGSSWRAPGNPLTRGSIADYEVDWSEQIRLETSLTMPPLPTCTRCRACADGACDLESGTKPDDLPRWATRAPLPKVDRNGPCPCGSGKKFKKCCGK